MNDVSESTNPLPVLVNDKIIMRPECIEIDLREQENKIHKVVIIIVKRNENLISVQDLEAGHSPQYSS